MNTQIRNTDSTNVLTDVESKFNVDRMLRLGDIEKALEQQFREDERQLKLNYAEQNKLRPKIIRYRHLEKEAKARETRMRRAMALLGEDRFKSFREYAKAGKDVFGMVAVIVDFDVPLWEAIAAVVEQAPGIQVVELQHALEHLGRKASRQAIESALATHTNEFETKIRGREKFVSLKGA
jgi:hypothetical protein